jgi:hypothetical protein
MNPHLAFLFLSFILFFSFVEVLRFEPYFQPFFSLVILDRISLYARVWTMILLFELPNIAGMTVHLAIGWDGILQTFCLGWLISASQIARIIVLSHHTQPLFTVIWIGSCLCQPGPQYLYARFLHSVNDSHNHQAQPKLYLRNYKRK